MRIGLVSPYDFAYPGGVTEHVSHLAVEFRKLGHEVHILAPTSADAALLTDPHFHRFGRVVPIPANGSVARIELSVRAYSQVKRLLREAVEQAEASPLPEPATLRDGVYASEGWAM